MNGFMREFQILCRSVSAVGVQIGIHQFKYRIRVQPVVWRLPFAVQRGKCNVVRTYGNGILARPCKTTWRQVHINILLKYIDELQYFAHIGDRHRLLSHGL